MIKTVPLQNLQNGDKFEIPFLKDSMRNLQVCRVGSCSVGIKGERFIDFAPKNERGDSTPDDVGKWKPFAYSIALSTPVVYLGKGELTPEGDVAPKKRGRKPKVVAPSNEVKRGRGRPRNPNKVEKPKSGKGRGRPAKILNIVFPKTGNFTIADVAKASGCEKYDVINYLAKMKKAGTPIDLKEKGKLRNSKRGRATTVYSLK